MDILAAAVQGLNAAQDQVDQAAVRLSRAATVDSGAPGDIVDLSTEIVNLMAGKLQYEANLKSLQTGGEMVKHTLDIVG